MEQRTKHVFATLVVSLVVVILASVILMYAGVYDVAADRENGAIKTWVLETVKEYSISTRANRVTPPDLSGRERLLEGIQAYDQSCSGCHGTPAEEPGAFAEALNPSAPWIGGIDTPPSDGALKHWFWATKHGIEMTGMPAWGEMMEDEKIWSIVAAMREFPDIDGARYEELLAEAETPKDEGASTADGETEEEASGRGADGGGVESAGDTGVDIDGG